MKNSYPVKMAEYAVHQRITGDPAFAWWIQHVLTNHNHTIGNMKSNYWVQTHLFGIKTPKAVQEANEFEEENGNTLWWDAILKKMKNSDHILKFGRRPYQSCRQFSRD